MATFAVIENGVVTNVIIAEDKKTAEEVTQKTCVEYDPQDSSNPAYIGAVYYEGSFRAPQPFPSWSFNQETSMWEAPTPKPTDKDNYYWSEETLTWVKVQG